jgi:DNA-directed RNA polymerase subunit RPC12/RpoP
MDKSKYGVHKTHCCVLHGCKYGDSDCPVTSGEIKQSYICEDCDNIGIKKVSELEDIIEHGSKQCPRCGYHLKIYRN